jgi:anti-anti-sigma factor
MEPVQLDVTQSSRRLFVLVGELEMTSVQALTDAVDLVLEDDGDIVLDLAQVSFMGSTGIRALIRISRGLGRRGQLILSQPCPLVARLLDLTRLVDVLPNLVVVPNGRATPSTSVEAASPPVLDQSGSLLTERPPLSSSARLWAKGSGPSGDGFPKVQPPQDR